MIAIDRRLSNKLFVGQIISSLVESLTATIGGVEMIFDSKYISSPHIGDDVEQIKMQLAFSAFKIHLLSSFRLRSNSDAVSDEVIGLQEVATEYVEKLEKLIFLSGGRCKRDHAFDPLAYLFEVYILDIDVCAAAKDRSIKSGGSVGLLFAGDKASLPMIDKLQSHLIILRDNLLGGPSNLRTSFALESELFIIKMAEYLGARTSSR